MKKILLYILTVGVSIAGLCSCNDAKSPVLDNAIYLIDATERDGYDCILKTMSRIDFNATVRMTSRTDHPVTITVTVDESDITAHNAKYDETLKILPSENWQLTDPDGNPVDGNSVQITLAPNETTALLPISIFPVGDDDINQYALPVKISGASDGIRVLGNQSTVLYMFQKPFETTAMILEPYNKIRLALPDTVPSGNTWTVEFHFTLDLNAVDNLYGQPTFMCATSGGGEMIYIRIYKPGSSFDIHAQGVLGVASFNNGNYGDKSNQGIWHHVACVCKGGVISSYFDGELQASHSSGKWLEPVAWGEVGFGDENHSGYIGFSEVRLWSTARTVDDLKRNKYEVSPNSKGLVCSYRLNVADNGMIKDESPNGFDIDISGKSTNYNNIRWCKVRTDDNFKSFVTVTM